MAITRTPFSAGDTNERKGKGAGTENGQRMEKFPRSCHEPKEQCAKNYRDTKWSLYDRE